MEPFLLPVREDYGAFREDLDPKIQAIRELAREFKAVYVPLDGLFAAACIENAPEFWAYDGIHPTAEGHSFIAKEWLKAAGV